jgi:hypothetical protein
MHVTLKFIDALSSSAGKKQLEVRVEGPVIIKDLYKMAGDQEGKPALFSELEGFMISCDGVLLVHREALRRMVYPGRRSCCCLPWEGG